MVLLYIVFMKNLYFEVYIEIVIERLEVYKGFSYKVQLRL